MTRKSDPKTVIVIAGAFILLGVIAFVWAAVRPSEGMTFTEAAQKSFILKVFAKHRSLLDAIGVPVKH